MAVQAAVAKRPNQGPLIAALQGTIAHQHQNAVRRQQFSQASHRSGSASTRGHLGSGQSDDQDDPIFPMPGRS